MVFKAFGAPIYAGHLAALATLKIDLGMAEPSKWLAYPSEDSMCLIYETPIDYDVNRITRLSIASASVRETNGICEMVRKKHFLYADVLSIILILLDITQYSSFSIKSWYFIFKIHLEINMQYTMMSLKVVF